MKRIDHATATAEDKFTDGDPGSEIPATVVPAKWLNDVQEELAQAIEARMELDGEDDDQLRQALRGGGGDVQHALLEPHEVAITTDDAAKAKLVPYQWFNTDAGGTWRLLGRFLVPKGARVTELEVQLRNETGGNLDYFISLRALNRLTNTNRNLVVDHELTLGGAASGWHAIPLGGVPEVIADGDVLRLEILMPSSTSDTNVVFEGARLKYDRALASPIT